MEYFKKPHYDLEELKTLIQNPKTRVITDTARKNAFSLGLITDSEIVRLVLAIKKSDIYKTMTCHANSKIWQDVYTPTVGGTLLYIKLQKSLDQEGVVVQLKESDTK